MITFKLLKNGLYLSEADYTDPGQAQAGFLFQDQSRTDPTFVFSASEWTSSKNQGYFAFFDPSATRDWSAFAGQVRAAFQENQPVQIGWFSGPSQGVNLVSSIQVSGQGTASPTVQGAPAFVFGNITLFIAIPFGGQVSITFDDASNSFLIANPNPGSQNAVVQLTVQPLSGSTATFYSNSPNLTLPLTGSGAGAALAGFQIPAADPTQSGLEVFETGVMYFGPPVQGQLAAFNYPVFRGPGGSVVPLNLSASFDVLSPVDPNRTFLQFTDSLLGSYFAAPTGQVFGLQTVNDSPAESSRLVFANRPVNTPQDTGTYYLTPAGKFNLAIDTGKVSARQGAASAYLLAGTAGTEFFNVSLGATPDALVFVPAQPAFKQSGGTPEAPTFLGSVDGNVTTSWAKFVTTGTYVSQPEQSPLYRQNGQSPAGIAGAAAPSGLTVYLLNFNAVSAWPPPQTKGSAPAPATSPLVPLAPYAGISSTSDTAAFRSMEVEALSPTRKNAFVNVQAPSGITLLTEAPASWSMTPQGLLAGLDPSNVWSSTQFATSPSGILQFENMGSAIRAALQQNQIFVVATHTDGLFSFAGADQQIEIAGWPFNLSPEGQAAPDGTPPILILKFYQNKSISQLVDDISFWSQPATFNTTFSAQSAQAYLQKVILDACEQVYGKGKCPPAAGGTPDTSSIYYPFYQAVTDPSFSGVLAVNCNMELNSLPSAIRAVMGGMTTGTPPVSAISAFRVHHVGVQINDTDPAISTPTLGQSSLFGLVDYEKPAAPSSSARADGIAVDYNFEVEYLRALFTNSELRNFSCQINLTINSLFSADVSLDAGSSGLKSGGGGNVVVIQGSYQSHSTTGDDSTSGEGVYSFVAQGEFSFNFTSSTYLQNVTLTKLQFSFDQETPVAGKPGVSIINSSFAIWGSMVFQNLQVLDIFSFEKLVFENLGIDVSYQLTIADGNAPASTIPSLAFHPGDLRFDLGNTTNRPSSTSMLSLLPFKLQSFLYSENADKTLEDLNFFSLSSIPNPLTLADTFNYALIFELDLGSAGALGASLSAFKFSFLVGWLGGDTNSIAFGVQMPEADGKLEITIEGVFSLVIGEFILKYSNSMLVVGLHQSYMEILGKRLPPSGTIDFALFAPTEGASKIGWMVALNNEPSEETALLAPATPALTAAEGGGTTFDLLYLGLGQRVGPNPSSAPTDFAGFLKFMTTDFWTSFQAGKYDEVYHPDGGWIVLTHFKLLEIVEVGFVFYDYTPFYSLVLNVEKLFNFEITYTKISDTIGLFYANLSLPDELRTFQVGAASLTLPSIGISVYTNGNFKLDVGFPDGDDWSRCFQIQAMAGPVPVTGAGGFYIASLSSATSDVFTGNYPCIIAFGFAARLGVGKDFKSGPLSAGISVTFFGIIEGACGYLATGSNEIFQKPDALMLQGQFGIIGQLYGAVDFGIVKASVNVTLQASIGIVLHMEPGIPGTILLYIQASVSVSIKVSIDLGLFSISISFSFSMSIRFQWELGGSSSQSLQLAFAARALAGSAPVTVPLCPGMNSALPLWFLPEMTVVFPDSTNAGTPWFVCSLGIAYNANPQGQPAYSAFQPFETLAAQMVTWTLANIATISGCSSTVTQDELSHLDQNTEALIGWITWDALLNELQLFQAAIAVPTQQTAPPNATVFPMIPFLQLQTTGRLDSGNAADFNYLFNSKNLVPDSYLEEVNAYFNQLFVNQSQSASTPPAAVASALTPLTQQIFTDYFTGLIRGAVHLLLETMQNDSLESSPIDQLIQKAVGAGQFVTLAGQMSSSFRGGARLPNTAGLTLPSGIPQATNPLYTLLWQQFPAGQVPSSGSYSIALTNPDGAQKWVTSSVKWPLTSDILTPWQGLTASAVTPVSAPVAMPFTSTGPQSFSFQNATAWTQPQGASASLRPFPANLTKLESSLAAEIEVLVQSRETGAAYLPGGTPLPASGFTWATTIQLTVKQVPTANSGKFLPDVYSLAGASQEAQFLLEQIIKTATGEIASIQILYQSTAGAAELNSATINATDVFVLRTNTTTVAAPPSLAAFQLSAVSSTTQTPVGANIGEASDFLEIIQQAAVTNAPGYYLRYVDAAGKSLPTALFSGGPAPLTVLIEFKPDGSQNTPASPAQVQPWYNAVILNSVTAGLLYYADTTASALSIQYPAIAPGAAGMLTTRTLPEAPLQLPAGVAAAHGLTSAHSWSRQQLVSELAAAGITDESRVRATVAAAGGTTAQLNSLYSLVGYQVAASTGFIQSNLSAPIQPTNVDGESQYQAFVPLYSIAIANQNLPAGTPPDRYASIGDAWSASIYLNDAFGNQLPVSQPFSSTDLYFDPITPLDQWLGVVAAYDFLAGKSAQPGTLTVYLNPSATAFTNLGKDLSAASAQLQAALALYQTIQNQLTGPGVSLYIESSLSLQTGGTLMNQVLLNSTQTQSVLAMVAGIIAWLQKAVASPSNLPAFAVAPVPITAALPAGASLPPLFQLSVLFGIERETDLIDPSLKDQFGMITFPSAQNVATAVASTVGQTQDQGASSVSIVDFAANFVVAFPSLTLSVGLNGASQANSSAARAKANLKRLGVPGDGSGGSVSAGPQSLWAVQTSLLGISIGTSATPYYASPKPLDNSLNSGTVPLPVMPSGIPPLPTQQLFADVDLDQYGSVFFQAVDNFLAAAPAANAFEVAPAAYHTVAQGRESVANKYSTYEVDWLFSPNSPFTGTTGQLTGARDSFGQQMRSALMSAYAVDTIVQYPVTWSVTPPPSVQDLVALYGQVQPASGLPQAGITLSASHVAVDPSGKSLLTFLLGTNDPADIGSLSLDLVYNVTHIEYFLASAGQTPPDQARPSMWLQLVNPYPQGIPHVGPAGPTTIPVVFRQYPTPPTLISQSAVGSPSSGSGSLADAASWIYSFDYQVQLTPHDQLGASITYNTDLSASGSKSNNPNLLGGGIAIYTLFEALARFFAANQVLQPILATFSDPNWAAAANTFASLVAEVVSNSDWNPSPALRASGKLVNITDNYIVTDIGQAGTRVVTLSWTASQGESSFQGAQLSIEALDPNSFQPYAGQTGGTGTNSITCTYTPVPPLVNDWVVHQVAVSGLNVLSAENALAGVQVERNVITLRAGADSWQAKSEFVYKTPLVRPSQQATPFVDNNVLINVATLPNQGQGAACPPSPSALCQRIYTMLNDLIGNPSQLSSLRAAKLSAGLDDNAPRRVKMACGFTYPVASAVGGNINAASISPVFPVVLARSFDIDGSSAAQVGDLASAFATAISTWAGSNGIVFGSSASPVGGGFIFDITLYAQLSGVNTPVLRLSNLQLQLTDIDPS